MELFLKDLGKYADLMLSSGQSYRTARGIGRDIERHFKLTSYQPEFVQPFKMLGAGIYAAVFTHPYNMGRVLKVGLNTQAGKTSMDDAWTDWAGIAMMAPKSPFLPQIYQVRLHESAYVAEMEKLERAAYKKSKSPTGRLSARFLTSFGNNVRYAAERRPGWEKGLERLSKHENFDASAFDYMVRLFRVVGTPRDLHNENVMLRGNDLVATDPFAYKTHLNYKVSLSSYATKINGVSIVTREDMQAYGQDRVLPIHRAFSAGHWEEKEGVALWTNPVDAIQPGRNGLPRFLSQVQYERLPKGSDIVTRLQQAA